MVRARGAAQHIDFGFASKAKAAREDMQSERERCRERVRRRQRQNCQRDDQMDKDRATKTTQWSARREDLSQSRWESRCGARCESSAATYKLGTQCNRSMTDDLSPHGKAQARHFFKNGTDFCQTKAVDLTLMVTYLRCAEWQAAIAVEVYQTSGSEHERDLK